MRFKSIGILAVAAGLMAAAPAYAKCGSTLSLSARDRAVSGSFRGYEFCEYRFQAHKGQVLTATLLSRRSLEMVMFSPVNDFLTSGEGYTIPRDGIYRIRVFQMRAFARRSQAPRPFTLRLRLSPAK